MKPTDEQYNDFFSQRPLCGVIFELNDSVIIVNGECVGQGGAIICVDELGDDPIYRVELGGSGKDVFVKQSCLRMLEG